MSMSSSTAGCEIKSSGKIYAVTCMPDGKHLVSGGQDEVQVWRHQDGQKVATLLKLEREVVVDLAVSNDGRWIAAGTDWTGLHVWSAGTYERRFEQNLPQARINSLDFSPDSTQLVMAATNCPGAFVWDVTTWNLIRTLEPSGLTSIIAAKYSPQGDRIVMVTPPNLIIWDRNNGKKLVEIPVECTSNYSARCGFAWYNDHLFVVSGDMVVRLDTSTGSTISKWAVPSSRASVIAVPQHGMFFTYSAGNTVTIWDASSPTALAVIHQNEDIRSSCLSKDDQFIVMGGESGRIALKSLSTVLEVSLLVDSSTPAPLLMEWVKSMLTRTSWKDVMAVLITLESLRFVLYHAICDHLETFNNVIDAVQCFHQMSDEFAAEISTSNERTRWAADFRRRCLEKLPAFGDAAASAQRPDEAIAHYSAALSLNPSLPQAILVKRSQAWITKGSWQDAFDDTKEAMKLDPQSTWNYENVLSEWVKVELTDGPWRNTFSAAGSFEVPKLIVYKTLCEHLEMINRITDATECLRDMICELEQDINSEEVKQILRDFLNPRHRLHLNDRSVLDIKSRSCKELEDHGDAAMIAKGYEKAISLYSIALGLGPHSPQDLFVKRSKAHAERGMWEGAINDANEAIAHDPVSLTGHEQKYAALCGTGRYQDALYAFESLLEKMSESPDANIRDRCRQYKDTRKDIRSAVQDAIRELPRVLINTITGCLCDKTQQAAAFESSPIFIELISSTSTHVDRNRIEEEVSTYYRYAMFSHKWEDFEPLYEKVIHTAVYDLEVFPTHNKLKTFCETARDAGFHWAWSDTCCVNKADHFVVQEALVSMFNWYQGSSLTIVFLRGVSSSSEHGDLVRSIWNSRIWTFQEYHASKVVRFYSEDWTLYRNLSIPNHKASPEIISEMEETTRVSADALTVLQPGLDKIREKLCLASGRQTTIPEDAAYALFGIFSVSLPVVYGERDHALGRLLARLLTSAGDTSILAWTGRSGSFNSCLPAEIVVFGDSPTTYIPLAIGLGGVEMDTVSSKLRLGTPQRYMTPLMKLHDRLCELPVPSFSDSRMKLPCIFFPLGRVSATLVASERVFQARTATFGFVQIRTAENLARYDSLILVHPWIDFLLDQRPIEDIEDVVQSPLLESSPTIPNPADTMRETASENLPDGSPSSAWQDPALSESASSVTSTASETLQFLARLHQPFGALLLTSIRRNMAEYRRVAADCLIRVQIQEDALLDKLWANVRVLDVL